MQLKKGEIYEGFRLIDERIINEIEGKGKWLYHEASGVTVLALQNKDSHKVFSVNFMTIPCDNTGTAHIVEHTVCCASQKYPLKETFMAATQGSICTTMNACTYPDRTMYYVASVNEKDLLGMATVFLDMVFHPLIEESEAYFLQEGWHYEYDEVEDVLDLSGVVYHEMIGEYGEAGSYLRRYELETLFPNTAYQYDSGGIPEEIPKLTREAFLSFYHQHYVGENATITLYGDLCLDTFLKTFNKTSLKHIEKGKKISPPKKEMTFKEPVYKVAYYPTSLKNGPTLMSLGFVIGDSIDCKMRLAFEMLEQMLLRSTASPLLKALVVEEQLGMSLSDGGYDSCRQQPVFSITLKGAEQQNAKKFEQSTIKVLHEIVQHGLDLALIDAAIESLEFELRETDASYEPIGIVYSEMMLSSYLYGGNPFNHIAYRKALEEIKKQCHKGYFEDLIQTYFLENTHRSLTVVVPSSKMQAQKEAAQYERLKQTQQALGEEGLNKIIQMNEWLDALQLKENEEAILQTLPQLTLQDMPESLEPITLETLQLGDQNILYHTEATKDIVYLHFLWDIQGLTTQQRKDCGLLAHIFSYIGTRKHSYQEIENTINTLSGGLHVALHAYTDYEDGHMIPIFKVSGKVMQHHLNAFLALMTELFNETVLDEKDKLKELIGHIVYEMERSFTGAPEYRAVQRVYTYLCEQAVYEDEVSGLAFYEYIKEIYEHYDVCYDTLKGRLMEIMQHLFNRSHLKLAVTAPNHLRPMILEALKTFLNTIPNHKGQWKISTPLSCNKAHEGFFNGQDGQAIAMGIDFKKYGFKYKGQYEVVANILENTYLWDRIRLQGGAYGCDLMLSKEGYLVLCSYCDPHLQTTLDTYRQIGDYLETLKLEKSAIERAVISTLGAMIAPCSMEQKSERACMHFITGMPLEARQDIYNEIRQTCLSDFDEMSQIFKLLSTEGKICVFGTEEKLKQKKSQFKLIDLKI